MKINFLDHVAIRVKDPEKSAQWYGDVLGLTVFKDEAHWGPFPIMVLAGESGIALFPKKEGDDLSTVNQRMHLAFNVERKSFEAFQQAFGQRGVEFRFEDHYHFHSIYITDPDGYTIELTTKVR